LATDHSIKCEFKPVDAGKIKAFVNVEYGVVVMKDFKIIQNDDGELWVAPPSRSYKDSEGAQRWTDTIWIPDLRAKKAFQAEVLHQYQEAENREREEAQQDAARTATVRPDGTIALPTPPDEIDVPF
jgi:DNA-binding cell septation regulator SpoVG